MHQSYSTPLSQSAADHRGGKFTRQTVVKCSQPANRYEFPGGLVEASTTTIWGPGENPLQDLILNVGEHFIAPV